MSKKSTNGEQLMCWARWEGFLYRGLGSSLQQKRHLNNFLLLLRTLTPNSSPHPTTNGPSTNSYQELPFLSLPGKPVLIRPISRVIPLLHPLQIGFSLSYLGTHRMLYPVLSLWHFNTLPCYPSCLFHWTVIPIKDWAMPFNPQYLGILCQIIELYQIIEL